MKRSTRASVVASVALLLSSTAVVFALDAQAATRYEAESAPASCGGTIAANHSGYSGTGFCDTPSATGAAAQFTVDASSTGTATVDIRYANGSTANRPADISVNGAIVQAGFAFEGTGAWNAWATRTLTVRLNAGDNPVR